MTHQEALDNVAKERGMDSWELLLAAYEGLSYLYGVSWLVRMINTVNAEAVEAILQSYHIPTESMGIQV
jgi:hypothetical protein